MFNHPIKYVRITSMEELLKFSYRVQRETKVEPLCFTQNDGQIAFSNERGMVRVTPYRPEIQDLLEANGYHEGGLSVPFNSASSKPAEYQWLMKIAREECWAYTHEKAFQLAQDKGIHPVSFKTSNLRVREVTKCNQQVFDIVDWRFYPLASLYLLNEEENVGTYILVDERTVVLCDEYGRTFVVQAKAVINDFVNALISSGYTRTVYPELYVKEPPEEEPESADGETNE